MRQVTEAHWIAIQKVIRNSVLVVQKDRDGKPEVSALTLAIKELAKTIKENK